MSDLHAGFEAAMRQLPADSSVRAIYGDWLEEHGDDEGARVQRLEAALMDVLVCADRNIPLV